MICRRWNKRRRHLQEALTGDIFVPGISFCLHEERPRSYVVWSDAIPIILYEALPHGGWKYFAPKQ